MSDFDFDELDKAVNSALQTETTPIATPVTSSAPVVSNDTTEQMTASHETRTSSPSVSVHRTIMTSRRVPRGDLTREQPAVIASSTNETSTEESVSVSQPESVQQTPDLAELSQAIDVAAIEQEAAASDNPQPEVRSVVSNNRSVALPRRRSGRFMDVKHDSSDMKTTTTAANEVAPTPAVADVLPVQPVEPVATELASPVGPVVDDVPAPIDVEALPSADRPIDSHMESAINDLLVSEGHAPVASEEGTPPDEIATVDTIESVAVEPEAPYDSLKEPKEVAVVAESDVLSGLDFEEISTPSQTSPFVEGVEVEKRPLGTFSSDSDATQLQAEGVASTEEARHPDDPTASRTLPEELSVNLTSIETSVASEVQEVPVAQAVSSPVLATTKTIDDVKKDSSVSGPTSIAKQYKEQPQEVHTDANDIFDTKNYHTPLGDDKTTSHAGLWIVVGVIVAVVIAAAVFAVWKLNLLPVSV